MIEFDERRPWTAAMLLLVIGPGGAGKSSLGTELAPLLNRCLVDLDYEFCRRREDISAFMRREGYARYKMENSALAAELAAEAAGPTILIASSGFLTLDNPPAALQANRRLLEACYSVCLLPSRDLERSISIIVERQLARPFAREKEREEAVVRVRHGLYARAGDLVVFSDDSSGEIAKAIQRRFGF